MSRMIRVIIQNSSYQMKNREEVKNREIRYIPEFFIFNLLSVNNSVLIIQNSLYQKKNRDKVKNREIR